MTLNSLRAGNNFLNWRYEARDKGEKKSKVPYSPLDCKRVGTNEEERSRWGTYEQSIENKGKDFDGIGFVFTRFNDTLHIGGIDIDHQDIDGDFTKGIISMFSNAYIEKSPSGEGVHIILLVDINRLQSDYKDKYYQKNPSNGCEAYIAGLTNRYFTFTESQIQDGQDIDQTEELIRFLDKYMLKSTEGAKTLKNSPLSDDDIISKARASENGEKFIALFDKGDVSNYNNDDSRADIALLNILAFWTRCDAEQMERLFNKSALGQREKWENRDDYRKGSIAKAILGCVAIYDPQGKQTAAHDFTSNPIQGFMDFIPFEQSDPLPLFPLDSLPAATQEFIFSAAETVQAPIEMVGSCVLGALQIACNGRFPVGLPNGHIEQPCFYILPIAPPSERKSGVTDAITMPLNEYEKEYNQIHRGGDKPK